MILGSIPVLRVLFERARGQTKTNPATGYYTARTEFSIVSSPRTWNGADGEPVILPGDVEQGKDSYPLKYAAHYCEVECAR
jgi:hypothetical protein